MKYLSWNVNGIRAAVRHGFLEWFEAQNADFVCVQEIKANQEQLDSQTLHPLNYHSFWHSAQKPGYSGVAIYCKKEPQAVHYGINVPEIDREGRVILVEYSNFVLINAYFPNSQPDHARLTYKLDFCHHFLNFCEKLHLAGKELILCGDFNIAHQPIDLKNPQANQNQAGFLPQERAWMDTFLQAGYLDTFRMLHPEPGHYTWWSYRPGVRERNVGWRIDYFMTHQNLKERIQESYHQPQVKGSDHCPIALLLKE